MKKKILIVDDETSILKLLKFSLERTGYEVQTETLGSRTVAIAESFKPDAILLDVNIPDMDGGIILGELMRRIELSTIPVVFLTGAVSNDEAETTTIQGRPVVAKPIQMERLHSMIQKITNSTGPSPS